MEWNKRKRPSNNYEDKDKPKNKKPKTNKQ